jgi:hypothetical protein
MKHIGNKLAGLAVLASSLTNSRGGQLMNEYGQIQASSKRDAMAQIAEILAAQASGTQIVTASEAVKQEAAAKNRKEVLAAMIADKTGETTRKVGEQIAGTVNMNLDRMGFARNLMKYQPLEQGQRPEVYVQQKNVTAVLMSGPTQAQLQIVRDPVIFPKEVDITGRLVIEGRIINTSREDVLQRKFNEALEQIIVQEDIMFKTGLDTLIDATGQSSIHAGPGLTVGVFESGIELVRGFNMPLASILFASNMFSNFITNREFEDMIEPVSRLEILRTGTIGTWYGATVMTDGVREPTQKVLNAGEIYFFSSPEYVGEYTDRGGVQSTPLTVAETGVNGAGWHLVEYMSQALPNHRAVARTRLV